VVDHLLRIEFIVRNALWVVTCALEIAGVQLLLMDWMRTRWFKRKFVETYLQFMFAYIFYPAWALATSPHGHVLCDHEIEKCFNNSTHLMWWIMLNHTNY
jgi:hypothetical protein